MLRPGLAPFPRRRIGTVHFDVEHRVAGGRSDYDPAWRNYQPGTYFSGISQLLALANVHRVVVAGTSFGGVLAIRLGALTPLTLAGVVLNDADPEDRPGQAERYL